MVTACVKDIKNIILFEDNRVFINLINLLVWNIFLAKKKNETFFTNFLNNVMPSWNLVWHCKVHMTNFSLKMLQKIYLVG